MSQNIYFDTEKDRTEVVNSGEAPVSDDELEECDFCGSTKWEYAEDRNTPLVDYECAECGKGEVGVE